MVDEAEFQRLRNVSVVAVEAARPASQSHRQAGDGGGLHPAKYGRCGRYCTPYPTDPSEPSLPARAYFYIVHSTRLPAVLAVWPVHLGEVAINEGDNQ